MKTYLMAVCTVLWGIVVAPSPASGMSPEETPLESAVAALEVAHPLPEGWTVKLGESDDGTPAWAEPDDDGGGGTITIDPEAIADQLPDVDEDEANLPGVLYVFLLHEWYHANESAGESAEAGGGGQSPYNTSPKRICGEIQLQPGIAAQHCALICLIVEQGNGKIGPLCELYGNLQESYNNGYHTPGGASALHEKHGCPGDYPGDIPDCPCCPGGDQ